MKGSEKSSIIAIYKIVTNSQSKWRLVGQTFYQIRLPHILAVLYEETLRRWHPSFSCTSRQAIFQDKPSCPKTRGCVALSKGCLKADVPRPPQKEEDCAAAHEKKVCSAMISDGFG